MTDTNHDPFEEEETQAAEETQESDAEAPKQDDEQEGEGETQTGEEDNASAPPADAKEGDEESAEKMIPESRFKAAIKDVTAKLDQANQKLASLEAVPVPDKEKDPQGFDLHVRMETSKALMREIMPDYDDVIRHYKELADSNPYLNQAVAAHPAPAKHAYDIAKKDMEIRELSNLKNSDEWKEFQAFKKSKAAQAAPKEAEKTGQKAPASPASKVPNLNRATSVARSNQRVEQDDELFAGAL